MEELENSAEQAPEQTAPGWYEGVTFEDAKIFIKSNIMSAARSFIAIGYYLKVVRDKEMYLEDGHATIWDFAKTEFGISMSTASRYMTMNDRFSKDGNSPVVADDYKEFGKSQLQEMLSLTDEQLEQVKPSDRVEDIRSMRKPKEIPYIAIPGQVELTDFPGIEPEDVVEASKAKEAVSASQTEKSIYTISAEDLLPDPELQETEQSIAISQQEPEPEPEKPTPPEPERDSCPPGITDCRRQEWGTEPEEQEAGKKECKACWASWKRQHKVLGTATVEQEQEEPQEPLSVYGTPKRVYPEDSLIAMAGCEGGHSCTSCHVECGIRQEDCYCVDAPMGNPFPCDILKTIQTLRDEIGSKCQFVDHGLAYHRAGDHEPVPCCKDCKEPCRYICDRAKKQLEAKANIPQKPNSPGNVIDGEFTEIQEPEKDIQEPEESLTELQIAQEELERVKKQLNDGLEHGVDENNIHIRRLKTKVCAWASYVCDLDSIMNPPPKPVQPELPVMKSNDQRKAWLRDYKSWGLWYRDENIGVSYYKYDFDNGARLIVEEYQEFSTYTGDYTSFFLHLVGGPKPPIHPSYGYEKWTYSEKYSRTINSDSELFEFLKALQQKKG